MEWGDNEIGPKIENSGVEDYILRKDEQNNG